MLTHRTPAAAPPPNPAAGWPRCHGGASSLLRVGIGAVPQRLAPAARLLNERPFLLRRRTPSLQLSLFGPRGAAR